MEGSMDKIVIQKLREIIDYLIEVEPDDRIPKCDGIFVFGHVDPRIAEHVAKLYLKKKADWIILTGGKVDPRLPKGFSSEAEYYGFIILERIIKSRRGSGNSLILEEKSANSLENVIFGMGRAMSVMGVPKSMILCAMPPLLRRSCATFRRYFPNIEIFGSAFKLREGEWLTKKRIKRVLGEIDRLQKYAEKGDIAPVEIPTNILEAYQLVRENL
jgi:uncharacterized SAM-binding protein YcdF (DUF218 family)